MLKLKNNKSKGFTIIEVLIVLAIAALILLIVFLAVPQLNNNFHDYQKKQDAAKIKTILLQYYTDHQSDPWPFPVGFSNNAICFSGSNVIAGNIVDVADNSNIPTVGYIYPNYSDSNGHYCDQYDSSLINWVKNNIIPSMSYYKIDKFKYYSRFDDGPTPSNGTYSNNTLSADKIIIITSVECLDNNQYRFLTILPGMTYQAIFYTLSNGTVKCLNVFK